MKRKYTTEWTLVLTVYTQILGRQQELARATLPEEPACHLYLVTTRPVISVLPESVELDERTVRGTVRLQRGDMYEEHPFDSAHSWGPGMLWRSEWPHDEYRIEDAGGRCVASGVVALLQSQTTGLWPAEAKRHRVEYVGQAFGEAGERTAWDRLARHETVQRILAETTRDRQVWLHLAAITDVNVFSEIDGRQAAQASQEEDDAHSARVIRAARDGGFAQGDGVALAEAGLIRFLQPRYNDKLKYRFPARRQVPLEAARSLDLHALVVELNGEAVGAAYGSAGVPPAQLHFASFRVHTEAGRADTMLLEAVNPLT